MGNMAVWLAVLAVVLGLFSLALEIFIFPGFGVAGLAGFILIAWGIALISTNIMQSLHALVIGLVGTIVFFAWAIRQGYKRKLWHRLALNEKQDTVQGYSAARPELIKLLGKEGVAVTKLRPAGAAEIDGERVDVVTEGGYILPGSAIIVIKVEGSRVVVKPN